jgi:hypothetical protein
MKTKDLITAALIQIETPKTATATTIGTMVLETMVADLKKRVEKIR